MSENKAYIGNYKFKVEKADVPENENRRYGYFTGYASVFGNVDEYGDIVEPGAFKKSLSESRPIPILWGHNKQQSVGVQVDAEEDGRGLLVSGKIPLESDLCRYAYSQIEVGAVRGLSIGGYVIKSDEEQINENEWVRHLRELKLSELSLTPFPANEQTWITELKHAVIERENMIRHTALQNSEPPKPDYAPLLHAAGTILDTIKQEF